MTIEPSLYQDQVSSLPWHGQKDFEVKGREGGRGKSHDRKHVEIVVHMEERECSRSIIRSGLTSSDGHMSYRYLPNTQSDYHATSVYVRCNTPHAIVLGANGIASGIARGSDGMFISECCTTVGLGAVCVAWNPPVPSARDSPPSSCNHYASRPMTSGSAFDPRDRGAVFRPTLLQCDNLGIHVKGA